MHRRPFKPKYVDDNKYTKNFQDPNKFYNDQTNIKDHRNITIGQENSHGLDLKNNFSMM